MGKLSYSRYDEIIVRLVPARSDEGSASWSTDSGGAYENRRAYDALVYTDLDLPFLRPGSASRASLEDRPAQIAGLPLASIGHVVVRWGRYQEYLAAFLRGSKNPDSFVRRLFEAFSPDLEELFTGSGTNSQQPVRIWWSSKTPELEDLPWELAAYSNSGGPNRPRKIFFVRGLPPEQPTPLLPVAEKLRLAYIHPVDNTPAWLEKVMNEIKGNDSPIEVVDMTGSPRRALQEAVKQGYELVHMVIDGITNTAYEGILYAGDTSAPQLGPRELSSLLRGSRVSMIGFTPPVSGGHAGTAQGLETMRIGEREAPSAYRAYTYLGSSLLPLPSILTPLAPLTPALSGKFWRTFYLELAASHSLDDALLKSMSIRRQAIPVALFLHHSYGKLFRYAMAASARDTERGDPGAPQSDVDPASYRAESFVSTYSVGTSQVQPLRDSLQQISSLLEGSKGIELPQSLLDYIEVERQTQTELEAQIDPWTELQGDER